MIETLTLITLSVLFLVFFRPGKTPPMENPLIIERPGQHHMTMGPQLNLAQPLLEAISKEIKSQAEMQQDSATLCFEVRDKQVMAHGQNFYLLAITQRNGMLYFQATCPQSEDQNSHYKTISEFAGSVLVHFPDTGKRNPTLDGQIVAAAQQTAQLRSINIKQLFDPENGCNYQSQGLSHRL